MIPTPYPRIPHLCTHPGADHDDMMLTLEAATELHSRTFCFEEKLDGFNVAISCDHVGWPQPFARSGKSHNDRGGQLGLVRSWIGQRSASLLAVLSDWPVLYGEWMRMRHSVAYDQLPDWLIVLDLWDPKRGFASLADRNAACDRAGMAVARPYFTGKWPGTELLEHRCIRSHYSTGMAEGVILRDTAGGLQGAVAKWLAPHFRRKADSEWGDAQNSLDARISTS